MKHKPKEKQIKLHKNMIANIEAIKTNLALFVRYISALNAFLSNSPNVRDVINFARTQADGLPSDSQIDMQFSSYSNRDKGNLGKLIEYAMFAQVPNSDAAPDLPGLNMDIKVTKLKTLKNKNFNAKERLTITNVGNPTRDNFGKNILENTDLTKTQYYSKIRKGLLIVVDNGSMTKYKTFDDVMNMRVMYFLNYDIEELPDEFSSQITKDYNSIRTCIESGNITQKGQKTIHIHPHGSKGSKTRAIGFTNKFVTTMLGYYMASDKKIPIENIIVKKGNSVSIKPSAFN